MKSTEIAVIKTSQKNGCIRTLHIWEQRSDGWIRGDFHSDDIHQSPHGTWIAPHNILSIHEKPLGWDYNGIDAETLVTNREGDTVIVKARLGAQYVVVDTETGEESYVSWEEIVPVETE